MLPPIRDVPLKVQELDEDADALAHVSKCWPDSPPGHDVKLHPLQVVYLYSCSHWSGFMLLHFHSSLVKSWMFVCLSVGIVCRCLLSWCDGVLVVGLAVWSGLCGVGGVVCCHSGEGECHSTVRAPEQHPHRHYRDRHPPFPPPLQSPYRPRLPSPPTAPAC